MNYPILKEFQNYLWTGVQLLLSNSQVQLQFTLSPSFTHLSHTHLSQFSIFLTFFPSHLIYISCKSSHQNLFFQSPPSSQSTQMSITGLKFLELLRNALVKDQDFGAKYMMSFPGFEVQGDEVQVGESINAWVRVPKTTNEITFTATYNGVSVIIDPNSILIE